MKLRHQSPFAENLQDRLKKAVKRAGGVNAVAEFTGYSAGSIYNYLKLQSPPQLDFIYGLCAASGVRPEWLFFNKMPVSDDDRSGDWQAGLTARSRSCRFSDKKSFRARLTNVRLKKTESAA